MSISRCRAGLAALSRGISLTATGGEPLPDDSSASTMTPLAPRCSSRIVRSPAASYVECSSLFELGVHCYLRLDGQELSPLTGQVVGHSFVFSVTVRCVLACPC